MATTTNSHSESALIIDLDQTLVDSQAVEQLRDSGKWGEVYENLGQIVEYPGIGALLAALKKKNVLIAVVTSSPEAYCKKLIQHFGWEIDATVCYHDTARKKPHPDPILAAIAKLHADKAKSISAGDRAIDIVASKAAGIRSIACLWGSKSPSALTKSGADYIARTVPDFSSILKTYFGL